MRKKLPLVTINTDITCPSCTDLTAKLQAAEETGAEATRMMVAAIARKEELEAAIRYHRNALTSGRTVCDQVLWMYISREPE